MVACAGLPCWPVGRLARPSSRAREPCAVITPTSPWLTLQTFVIVSLTKDTSTGQDGVMVVKTDATTPVGESGAGLAKKAGKP